LSDYRGLMTDIVILAEIIILLLYETIVAKKN